MTRRYNQLLIWCCLIIIVSCVPLPSAMSADITVIIHGLQPTKQRPPWTIDLALAINQTLPEPSSPEELKHSIINTSGALNPEMSDHFIVYDWATQSQGVGSADNEPIVSPLVTALLKQVSKMYKRTKKRVDIDVIAHSRGAFVACAAFRQLGKTTNLPLGFIRFIMLDPQSFGDDGLLEANPGGVVDWMVNFYQVNMKLVFSRKPLIGGHTISGALNVNLSYILKVWPARNDLEGGDHQEVADWFFFSIAQDDSRDPKEFPYGDTILNREAAKLHQEYKASTPTTRQLLYGGKPITIGKNDTIGPIVENFNAPSTLFWHQYRAEGDKTYTPKIVPLLAGVNEIKDHALQLTPATAWRGASLLAQQAVAGDFVVEFTLRIQPPKSGLPADGLAVVILSKNGYLQPIDYLGQYLGYGWPHATAITFDTFPNSDVHEPEDIASRIGIRVKGQRQSTGFFPDHLPEPVSSGHPFRIRLTSNRANRSLTAKIYSFGQDKVIDTNTVIPEGVSLPPQQIIAFMATTGQYAQVVTIDDILLVNE